MKSLYFVGNEELWNDAWFLALVESLKEKSVSIILLDFEKDTSELTKACDNLSAYQRMVFHKGCDVAKILSAKGITLSESKHSLIFVFSDIVNSSAEPKQLAWKSNTDEFLKNIGLWEGSQIIEDAFLFDVNLSNEVSRAIEKDESQLIDTNLLTADAHEFSQLIEIANAENKIEVPQPEAPLAVDSTKLDAPIKIDTLIKVNDSLKIDGTRVEALKAEAKASEDSELAERLFDEVSLYEKEAIHEEIPVAVVPATVVPVNEVEVATKVAAEDQPLSLAEPPGGMVASVEVSHLISSMSQGVSNEDLEVLKRYSSIKERELRESQAATEALRRQIRYFDERIKKSEEERRKLLLKLEETENELRTVADKKDENKAQLKNAEGRYEEKIKDLQVQLESSQFQAGKLEKKLEDFRERVRNDLQKIRSRERELASRLEIQKRDAEALLSAKDERLLNQKREMDRLDFELDALKERMFDEAQKNEDKRKRLSRALQSLKLAQSVLAGLDEDIFVKDSKDDKNKAA